MISFLDDMRVLVARGCTALCRPARPRVMSHTGPQFAALLVSHHAVAFTKQ